ncbi:2-oxoisovalerate dehydrogenase E2 component (dihydrolipoyl transacylase) [Marinobacter sp. LV10R510-11A]|uniref:2-oxo acid dehydrogenase subunit E2 n=1 Tax=Marinobacter sp. LV10R510-11A TaxID=1415568 RepID=UPI000BB8AFF0|nr:2-oxo acid dehydrogenase subunit E2 [Marinobacter sp. LV10R510-11A]SOB78228.1 2-oxoisovalerate dehydrogenase E2 component (dihydrolipoyl transacylase) [Marinobacter sp. LV10R510-11A]
MSDFILPDIGEGIVECELVKWLVSEGDLIEEDQPVAEVMTDKALVEIPAPYKGRVTRLYWKEGDIAKVHAPLFELVDESGEGSTEGSGEKTKASNEGESAEPEAKQAEAQQKPEAATAPVAKSTASTDGQRTPASPAVRRLVRENELTLGDIEGSGKDGRVLKADVLSHMEQPTSGGSSASESRPRRLEAQNQEVRIEPIKGMQAVMAKRMVASASTIPHFNFSEDIDVTELLSLRQQLKPEAEARGSRLTLMPFIMKAIALAVREYPVLNSQINEDVTEVHYQPHCNIGMAVDSKIGLLVPNVKNVGQLTLLEIANEVTRLTESAREGRVSQADLKGGTITISNIGALGGTYASPIINAPEVAIVALGRTQKLPRFDANGQVVERSIMTISWAGDHRIIDGGTIARFNNLWKGYLESPQSMLLHLG